MKLRGIFLGMIVLGLCLCLCAAKEAEEKNTANEEEQEGAGDEISEETKEKNYDQMGGF